MTTVALITDDNLYAPKTVVTPAPSPPTHIRAVDMVAIRARLAEHAVAINDNAPPAGGAWTGALTGGTGNTPTGVGVMTYARTGGAAVAGGEGVTIASKVSLSVTDGSLPDVRLGDLPVPPQSGAGVVAQLRVRVVGGTYAFAGEFDVALYDSNTKIRVFGATSTSGTVVFEISMHATYVAAEP